MFSQQYPHSYAHFRVVAKIMSGIKARQERREGKRDKVPVGIVGTGEGAVMAAAAAAAKTSSSRRRFAELSFRENCKRAPDSARRSGSREEAE